jgi:hypothetical protein
MIPCLCAELDCSKTINNPDQQMKAEQTISKTSNRTLWTNALRALALLAIAAALMTQPVFGQDHQLVLTENSSLDLTATLDGSTIGITFVPVAGPDLWQVDFTNIAFTFSPQIGWSENGGLNLVNNQSAPNGISSSLVIQSDLDPNAISVPIQGPFANGTTVFDVGIGSDNLPVDMTFIDHGDIAATPEPSTWAAGLLTAGAILCSIWRRRVLAAS